jgi:hypothetical protein
MTEQPSQLQSGGLLKDSLTFNNDQLWQLLRVPKLDTGYESSSSEEEDYSKYDNDYHYSESFDYNYKDPYDGYGHYDPYSRKEESIERQKRHEYESMWGVLLESNNDVDDAAHAFVHHNDHRKTQTLKFRNESSDVAEENQRCGESDFEIKIQFLHEDSAFAPVPYDNNNAKSHSSYPPFLKGSRIIISPQSSLYNQQQDLNNLFETKVKTQ